MQSLSVLCATVGLRFVSVGVLHKVIQSMLSQVSWPGRSHSPLQPANKRAQVEVSAHDIPCTLPCP